MTDTPLIETGTVRLDADLGDNKEGVLRTLAGAFVDHVLSPDGQRVVAEKAGLRAELSSPTEVTIVTAG